MPGRHFVPFCLLILAQSAAAELYTWTDDQGVTHFSDTAHAAQGAEQVTLGTSSIVPMAGNIRQSEKVSAIHQEIQQSLERDRPTRPARQRRESAAADKQCEKIERQIRKVQQQLRGGYSNDRGNSLRRQRRALSQKHSRQCILG